MLKALASLTAAAAVAISATGAFAQQAPKAAATPFAIGTFGPLLPPEAPVVGSPLPNIGRTRSVNRACAAMRDLIVPSFAAAVRADVRFAETRKRLPNYTDIANDPSHRDDGFREMLLTKLDADASTLLQEALVLNKALGDPRIAADVGDPQVMAERRSLQQLYEAQKVRANLLNEFVMRERAASAKQGIDDNSAFRSRATTNFSGGVSPPPLPVAALKQPPGMPLRSLNAMADKNAVTDWGASLATYVRKNENEAARTFYSIAQSCR
jgi:hypothetical protein